MKYLKLLTLCLLLLSCRADQAYIESLALDGAAAALADRYQPEEVQLAIIGHNNDRYLIRASITNDSEADARLLLVTVYECCDLGMAEGPDPEISAAAPETEIAAWKERNGWSSPRPEKAEQ